MTDERLWKVEDVAKFLGMKCSAVYQLVYKKRIPHLPLSKKCLRFDPVKIREWLKSKSRDAAPLPHRSAGTYKPKGGKRGRPRKNGRQNNYINAIIETAKKEVM
ncbi:MAG: helix-turn-helix transcriptional regulator [Nitrospirota bacterium]